MNPYRRGFPILVITLAIFAAPPGLRAVPKAVLKDARLADAVQSQDRALVRALLKLRADPNGAQPDRTTALIWAAHWGDLETVNLLLGAGADARAANRYGTSALTESAIGGKVAIMETLLKAGADPNAVSQAGESALMTAARSGRLEAVQCLLDHGANVNAVEESKQETALMYAVAEGHLPVVKLLIEKGANVNAVAHTSDTPRRATRAFPAEKITGGFTALMFAARQGELECARALLEARASASVSDPDGMTPMIIAAMNGHFETAALILEKGGDPNDGTLWETMEFRNVRRADSVGRADPVMASKLDALAFTKMLLDRGADPTKPYGKIRTNRGVRGTQLLPPITTSALERAAQAIDAASVRLMLNQAAAAGMKFDSNAILATVIQATAVIGPGKLVFRTISGKDVADAVAVCLDRGADVNAKNLVGNTPLHLAARQGADEVIKVLVERGAQLDAKNRAGLTPMDLAKGDADRAGEADAPLETHASTVALLRQLAAGRGAREAVRE